MNTVMYLRNFNRVNNTWEWKIPGIKEQSWMDNQGWYYNAKPVFNDGWEWKNSDNITIIGVSVYWDSNIVPNGFRKLPHPKINY